VHELAESVAAFDFVESGLMGGAAGVAVFFAYYADWAGDLRFKGLVGEMVERAINPPAGHFPGYSFASGFAGIGWTIKHLLENDLLVSDAASVYKQLDPVIGESMIKEMSNGHYDYLHGAGGMALYFLSNDTLDDQSTAFLIAFINELDRHSIVEDDGGVKWKSVLDMDTGREGYNLSLSHGIASLMLIIQMIRRKGVEKARCDKLLKGAYTYLRKQQLSAGNYLSIYPSWAIESMEDIGNSRLAWCYGDHGAGIACERVGEALDDKEIYNHGLNILKHAAGRRDPGDNRVMDAGICHGASGLALMNNAFYQHMWMNYFRDAAAHWSDVCLNMAYHDDGPGGYKAWYHPQYGGWVRTGGLLEGAAGIGLSLLSFVSPREPEWRKAFLIN
jgi:lantibiotic modifying enzyme